MKAAAVVVAALVVLLASASPRMVGSSVAAAAGPAWPAVTNQTRPWTRWWWQGSAVDAAGLTRELESLRAAGLGGVEITRETRANARQMLASAQSSG